MKDLLLHFLFCVVLIYILVEQNSFYAPAQDGPSHQYLLQCSEAALAAGQRGCCAAGGAGGACHVWHSRLVDHLGMVCSKPVIMNPFILYIWWTLSPLLFLLSAWRGVETEGSTVQTFPMPVAPCSSTFTPWTGTLNCAGTTQNEPFKAAVNNFV